MQRKAYSYIRFSTAEQKKGDSLRRQLAAAEKYATENNLDLVTLRDEGLSAYYGKHKGGAFGSFMQALKDGKIAPGSILIVEALDRISRESIDIALEQFMGLLRAGIDIVTLIDKKKYSQQSLRNISDLLISVSMMHLAHEESANKAKRLSDAWDEKRRMAEDGKPLTRQAPGWLKVVGDLEGFEIIKANADIVRRIFQMSADGIGSRKIAMLLNEANVKCFGRADSFNENYVRTILTSRSVIGEYQPKQRLKPTGEPISNYYPAVIDEALFYRVQDAIKERRGAGGKRTKTFTNLFHGMCKCTVCKKTFRLISHKKAKSEYYTCSTNYGGGNCDCTKRWRLRYLEPAILLTISNNVDWFTTVTDESASLSKLNADIASESARLSTLEAQADRYATLYAETIVDDAMQRYKVAMDKVAACKKAIDRLNSEIKAFQPADETARAFKRAISDFTTPKSSSDSYELRAKINSLIKSSGAQIMFGSDDVKLIVAEREELILTADTEESIGKRAKEEMMLYAFDSSLDDYELEQLR